MAKKVGIIGFGIRISFVSTSFVGTHFKDMEVTAIADIDLDSVRKKLSEIKEWDTEKIKLYEDGIKMLDEEKLDGVMIGTRCNLHTKFAVEALKRNIPVFLEKPVSVTLEECHELKKAVEISEAGGITSFPLRLTDHVVKVKEIYDSGALGTLSQIQAWNNVNYGRTYFKNWYRDESITGGLFMQKATHDVDYINYILGKQPVELCAMESKMVYKGDKPANLRCEDCPEKDTCDESRDIITNKYKEDVTGEYCSYASDTGNHDSATILMRYDDGLHVAYTQNFVARKDAGKRGLRMIGQRATIEFDWTTDFVTVISHEENKIDKYKIKPAPGVAHGGGDLALARDFLALMNGDKSVSSINAGIESAYICLCAKQSAQLHKFITL